MEGRILEREVVDFLESRNKGVIEHHQMMILVR